MWQFTEDTFMENFLFCAVLVPRTDISQDRKFFN